MWSVIDAINVGEDAVFTTDDKPEDYTNYESCTIEIFTVLK